MKNKRLKFISYAVIFILGIALDQTVKAWAYNELRLNGSISLIKDVFQLTYRENTGAAFSFLAGNNIFFMILTSVVILFLLYFIFSGRIRNKAAEISMLFIAMGGCGNLIDRFIHHFVVDMFDFTLINFAIFNVADSFITCGSILFIIIFIATKGEALSISANKKENTESDKEDSVVVENNETETAEKDETICENVSKEETVDNNGKDEKDDGRGE